MGDVVEFGPTELARLLPRGWGESEHQLWLLVGKGVTVRVMGLELRPGSQHDVLLSIELLVLLAKVKQQT